MFHKAQSIIFLIISAKPEPKLGQHLVDEHIVNVNKRWLACATDEAKLWLSLCTKQPLHLSTCVPGSEYALWLAF